MYDYLSLLQKKLPNFFLNINIFIGYKMTTAEAASISLVEFSGK